MESDESGAPEATDAAAVFARLKQFRPDYILVAAGECGGIGRNRREPATLMMNNLHVALAYLDAARQLPIRKILYLGSSCVYPRDAAQPMTPSVLGAGPLEPTSEPYAQAKRSGMILTQACRSQYGTPAICAIPSGPFGPWDSFDEENAHVIGALIRRMVRARQEKSSQVEIWGTGVARRDFIYVDDVADACLYLLNSYNDALPVNIGSGTHYSIGELAEAIRQVTGYGGRLVFDSTKPDGAPIKALDTTELIGMGWQPRWELHEALRTTCDWYLAHMIKPPLSL